MINIEVNILNIQVNEIDKYIPVVMSETAVLFVLAVAEFVGVKLTESFFVLVH